MELPIAEIVVPEGRRVVSEEKVVELAESIGDIGLLNPITVTTAKRLIAGAHRLSAMKRLGRETIEAVVRELSELDAELAEIDENLIRFDLTPAEKAKLTARRKAIYLAKYPETGHGKTPGKAGGGKKAKNDNLSSFADDTSKKAGKSKRTVERDARRGERVAEEVLDEVAGTDLDTGANLDVLTKLDEDHQKEVVKHAQEKGIKNLKTAARNLAKNKVVEEIKKEPAPMPEGPFRVIMADVPWPYERVDDPTHRGSIDYPPMSIEEMCALPVPKLANDDCILWFWTTNAFMHEAYHVVEAWGFEPKTILTWAKMKIGVGNWLRNQTEHCILAVKGKPVVQLTNQSTIIDAPRREHSRKPKEFYELVESLCPGSKVELFAREKRDGWERWGAEKEKFD
jgi:N6-adenosine-specific RNA methylase IME4